MLITAAQVADTLPGLSPTDSLLTRVVSDADSWIKRSLNRQFERAVYALKPRVYGKSYILLRESPIRAIVSAYSDPLGLFQPGTAVDVSAFFFNSDPLDDDPRLEIGGIAQEGTNTFLVNVEAGWWADTTEDHDEDLPESIRGPLITRARVEFKRASGVFDEETKLMTDEVILERLRCYQR